MVKMKPFFCGIGHAYRIKAIDIETLYSKLQFLFRSERVANQLQAPQKPELKETVIFLRDAKGSLQGQFLSLRCYKVDRLIQSAFGTFAPSNLENNQEAIDK